MLEPSDALKRLELAELTVQGYNKTGATKGQNRERKGKVLTRHVYFQNKRRLETSNGRRYWKQWEYDFIIEHRDKRIAVLALALNRSYFSIYSALQEFRLKPEWCKNPRERRVKQLG